MLHNVIFNTKNNNVNKDQLNSLLETHFEIVEAILNAKEFEGSISEKTQQSKGIGGLYELAMSLAINFENTHELTQWGVEKDFFETLDEFLKNKI